MRVPPRFAIVAVVALLAGCGGGKKSSAAPGGATSPDGSAPIAGAPTAGTPDASTPGAGAPDAAAPTTGTPDAPAAPAPTLSSIAVSPSSPSIPKGLAIQLTATASFSDGSTADVTDQVSWESSDAAIAAPSPSAGDEGLVQGVAAGTATITARHPSGPTNAVTLTVTAATLVSGSLVVSTATPSVPLGRSAQFVATGRYSDAPSVDVDVTSSATWSSSAPGVATVSSAPGAHGVATTLAEGSAVITARIGTGHGTTGSATLTVTPKVLEALVVRPETASAVVGGDDVAFSAIGIYSDDSETDLGAGATWSSSSDAVATVSTTGVAHAVATGSATIQASVAGLGVATAALTVVPNGTAALAYVTTSPGSVRGGTAVTGSVTLTLPAAQPIVVLLASDSPSATVPASVTVPAGASRASFQITTTAPAGATKKTSKTRAAITATLGDVVRSTTLLIRR